MDKATLEKRIRITVELYFKHKEFKETRVSRNMLEDEGMLLDLELIEKEVYQMLLEYSFMVEKEELAEYKGDKGLESDKEAFVKLVENKFGVNIFINKKEESSKGLEKHIKKRMGLMGYIEG